MLDIYLEGITSLLGGATSGFLTLFIVGMCGLAYVVGTMGSHITKKIKLFFWVAIFLAIIGIITNSYMIDYDKEHPRITITCSNTNTYPPVTFDRNVSVYHTSTSSRFGYGLHSQTIEVWNDNGYRCLFMNTVLDINPLDIPQELDVKSPDVVLF